METLKTGLSWINNVIPEGLPLKSTTLITGPGILIFGSALNLLLFSPTYGDAILETIKSTIEYNTTKTYIFSISTSAKAEEILQLEEIADNLILSRSEKRLLDWD